MSRARTMRAYRMPGWGQPPRLQEIPLPEPGPGEVRLKVAGNGLCASDLHLIHDWQASPPHLDITLPMTLGHEVGGWVDAPGPGVSGWAQGRPVLVTLSGCGRCDACLRGWNNYCRAKPRQPGIGMDGGLAEYVIAPVAGLVPCDGLDPARAAPLTDAGLSSYHAVRRVAGALGPGGLAVVIGAGGLGHLAIAALKAIGPARVLAVDPSPAARRLARRMGADAVATPDDPPEPQTAAAVLDFVGSGDSMALGARLTAPLGHMLVVGRGGGTLEFAHDTLAYGARLSTTFGGSRAELAELVALMRAGVLLPEVSLHPLDEVGAVLARLSAGQVRGRAVIVP